MVSGLARFSALFLLLAACHKPIAPPPDASPVTAPPVSAAAVPGDAAASATTAIDAGASCGSTQLQPDACASTHTDLKLDDARIRAWLAERGAKAPEITPAACKEIALGGEPMLVCIERHGAVADPTMGAAGPVVYLFDLEVIAVRKKQIAHVLKEPMAIGSSGASYDDPKETYFSAGFSVSADAIDLEATPAECTKALAGLPALFVQRKAEIAKIEGMDAVSRSRLVRATDKEEKLTAKRIEATCHAAGHYTLGTGGKLVAQRP